MLRRRRYFCRRRLSLTFCLQVRLPRYFRSASFVACSARLQGCPTLVCSSSSEPRAQCEGIIRKCDEQLQRSGCRRARPRSSSPARRIPLRLIQTQKSGAPGTPSIHVPSYAVEPEASRDGAREDEWCHLDTPKRPPAAAANRRRRPALGNVTLKVPMMQNSAGRSSRPTRRRAKDERGGHEAAQHARQGRPFAAGARATRAGGRGRRDRGARISESRPSSAASHSAAATRSRPASPKTSTRRCRTRRPRCGARTSCTSSRGNPMPSSRLSSGLARRRSRGRTHEVGGMLH